MEKTLLVVLGPTAAGKTDAAITLAREFKTEIISADSRQMYREMKIGTAVPDKEQLLASHHYFIGTISIHDYFNASMFEFEALEVLDKIFKQHDIAIAVGGSGLYIDALCRGIDDLPTIDPEIRNLLIQKFETGGIESLRMELKRVDPDYYALADLKNYKRILKALEVYTMTGKPYSSFLTRSRKKRDFRIFKLGLTMDREVLYRRIERRTDLMVEAGLVDEARALYPFKKLNALNTVGYKELFAHYDGTTDLETAIALIKQNTRRYAKKQLSYFNRDASIHWSLPENVRKTIQKIIP